MNDKMKYALLIDGDQTSYRNLKTIFDIVTNEGIITYRKMYADFSDEKFKNYKESLLKYSITPIQQFAYTEHKNSTDITLVIDAMDILHQDDVDGFCIVSSDSDFTRLAARLREAGKHVIVIGTNRTPISLSSACSVFKNIDLIKAEENAVDGSQKSPLADAEKKEANDSAELKSDIAKAEVKEITAKDKEAENGTQTSVSEEGAKKKKKRKSKKAAAEPEAEENSVTKPEAISADEPKQTDEGKDTEANSETNIQEEQNVTPEEEIRDTILRIIENKSGDDGWMLASVLGSIVQNKHPDFDSRHYGYKKFSQLLENFEMLDTKKEHNPNNTENPNGLELFVKIK